MARPDVKTRMLTREKLAAFLKSHELIKAFENLSNDVSEVLPDATERIDADVSAALVNAAAAQSTANAAGTAAAAAQSTANTALSNAGSAGSSAATAQAGVDELRQPLYVTMVATPATPNERVLDVDPLSLKLTDTGAGGFARLGTADLSAILGADIADSTAVFVNAAGLVLSLAANATYLIDGLITFQAAAITTGIGLGFTLPAGATISGLYHHNTTATAIEGSYNIASGAVKGNTSGVLVAAENVPITGRWIIKTSGTAGNAQLQFRSEVAASAVTLKAGLSALTTKRIA